MSGERPTATERRLASVRSIREQYYGASHPEEHFDAMGDLLAEKDARIDALTGLVDELRAQIAELQAELSAYRDASSRPVPDDSTPLQPVFDFYRD